jgi:hypothetical protein
MDESVLAASLFVCTLAHGQMFIFAAVIVLAAVDDPPMSRIWQRGSDMSLRPTACDWRSRSLSQSIRAGFATRLLDASGKRNTAKANPAIYPAMNNTQC